MVCLYGVPCGESFSAEVTVCGIFTGCFGVGMIVPSVKELFLPSTLGGDDWCGEVGCAVSSCVSCECPTF